MRCSGRRHGWTPDASHFLHLLGNAAPLIAFCAYLVKDIIWLRAIMSEDLARKLKERG